MEFDKITRSWNKISAKMKSQSHGTKNWIFSIVIMVLGLFVSFFIKDWRLATIFFLLWLDRMILGRASILGQFGLELTSMAVILTGLAYGPYFAAAYHFVASTLMVGLGWIITKSSEPNWPPFVPGPDQIVDALAAAIAGFLRFLPIVSAIVVASIAKFIIQMLKDKFVSYDKPPEVGRILNIFLNFAIAYELQGYLTRLV